MKRASNSIRWCGARPPLQKESQFGALSWFSFANHLQLGESLRAARAEEVPLARDVVSRWGYRNRLLHMVLHPAQVHANVTAAVLRFCPVCAEAGYHTSLFQFRLLALCPVHAASLHDCCQVCGTSLRFEAAWNQFMAAKGFACPSCKEPFAGMWPDYYQRHEAQAIDRSIRQAVSNLQPWLRGLNRLATLAKECDLKEVGSRGNRRPNDTAMRLFCFAAAETNTALHKLPFISSLPALSVRRLTMRLISPPRRTQPDAWPIYCQLVRDIQAQLPVNVQFNVSRLINKGHLDTSWQICPRFKDRRVLALALWRMKMEGTANNVLFNVFVKLGFPNRNALTGHWRSPSVHHSDWRTYWLAMLYEMIERVRAAQSTLVVAIDQPVRASQFTSRWLPGWQTKTKLTYVAWRETAPWLDEVSTANAAQNRATTNATGPLLGAVNC